MPKWKIIIDSFRRKKKTSVQKQEWFGTIQKYLCFSFWCLQWIKGSKKKGMISNDHLHRAYISSNHSDRATILITSASAFPTHKNPGRTHLLLPPTPDVQAFFFL